MVGIPESAQVQQVYGCGVRVSRFLLHFDHGPCRDMRQPSFPAAVRTAPQTLRIQFQTDTAPDVHYGDKRIRGNVGSHVGTLIRQPFRKQFVDLHKTVLVSVLPNELPDLGTGTYVYLL